MTSVPPTPNQSKFLKLVLQLYRIFQLLVAAAVIISLVWGWYMIRDPDQFPIKVVKIQATYQHLDRAAVAQQILPFVDRGFFNMNSRELVKQLQLSPWVADVSVHRIWPDTIIIKITEQDAVARWGKQALVNAAGKIFIPPANTTPTNLPLLNGADNQVMTLLQYYHDMSTILAPLKLTIAELDANERQALNLVLNNNMQIIIGRTDPIARLQRFATVYNKIFTSEDMQAQSIDLRYENGLSIKWKPRDETKPQLTTAGVAQ